jgi:hypothetical protein
MLQRTVQLNFRDNSPYCLPLNFDPDSPLSIRVVSEDNQSIMLQLNAPTELGGLANATIYQITNSPHKNYETLTKNQLELTVLKTFELSVPQEQTMMPLNYEQNYQQFYQHYQGGSTIFDDNLGFEGQTQLVVAKNQNTQALTQAGKTLLYVEATNIWGTTFHTITPVEPYIKPTWQIPLTQTTLYLLIIALTAITTSLILYFTKSQ